MCGEAFGIKTALTTVPISSDAAADAEGVRSLAEVAAVQMLDIAGGVHIGELVATVRGRTLETVPVPVAGSGGGGAVRVGGIRGGSGAGVGACAS